MDYQKIYKNLILKAKSENRINKSYYERKKENFSYVYFENHHIIPKCLGGKDDHQNLVLLTAREHYVAHKLLTYIYKGNRKITYAFHRITYGKNKYIKSSRDYAYAIELIKTTPISLETKEKMKGRIPWNKGKKGVYTEEVLKLFREKRKEYIENNKNNPEYIARLKKFKMSNFGKTFTQETKKKMSLSSIGIKKSEEAKKHMSKNHYDCSRENNGMFGKFHSNETRKKMSEKFKNRKKIKCEYCNKQLDNLNYKKWHGEKCKFKNTI